MKQTNRWYAGLGGACREYKVKKVKYVVSARFQKMDFTDAEKNIELGDCLADYLKSDFSELNTVAADDIITEKYAYHAAGKED